MLKIEKTKFKEKFTEINIRQRVYQGKNFITLMITTEFFPSLVEDNVVSGVVEVKLDIEGVGSLDELVGKHYQGDIGNITISVNNDGVWEQQSKDDFEVSITKRNGRELTFILKADNCELKTTGVMVSLYTTSSSEKVLIDKFDLGDFYDKPMIKEIGNNKILKYFVKE